MNLDLKLVCDRYAETYGASIEPTYRQFLTRAGIDGPLAVVGYARADTAPLFLERYLDEPVERMVGAAYDQPVERHAIVELGNLAACNGWALIRLWGQAANDLGDEMEYAVATLTGPLRRMFARIGLPIKVLAGAEAARSGAADWGSYYRSDPQVCVGRIAEGQQAIVRFLGRRNTGAAA